MTTVFSLPTSAKSAIQEGCTNMLFCSFSCFLKILNALHTNAWPRDLNKSRIWYIYVFISRGCIYLSENLGCWGYDGNERFRPGSLLCSGLIRKVRFVRLIAVRMWSWGILCRVRVRLSSSLFIARLRRNLQGILQKYLPLFW